jgi:uncharacterized membrane protein
MMSEFEEAIHIEAPAEEVFDFVSDVQNLPKYLPTVRRAAPQLGDRVEVEGTAAGRHYLSDGDFRVDHGKRCMQWGSDGENQYRGWMVVGGRNGTCEVKVHLSFTPRPDQAAAYEAQTGDRDRTIREGMRKALGAIKHIVEEQHAGNTLPRAA